MCLPTESGETHKKYIREVVEIGEEFDVGIFKISNGITPIIKLKQLGFSPHKVMLSSSSVFTAFSI